MQEPQTQNICHRCVRDTHLANQIFHGGVLSQCSYCYELRQTFPLDDLADRIHDVVQRHFYLRPNHPVDMDEFIDIAMGLDWEPKGCPPGDLVAEIAGLDQEIADDVVQHLSDVYAYRIVRDGGEDPYNYEARYERLGPDTGPFWSIWDGVPSSIQHQARFFNSEAERVLRQLFAELEALRTSAGESVIQIIGLIGDSPSIWRARKAASDSQLKNILANPAKEMGPPPPERALAGRMNAAGIPVFYGALDQNTCIAEVRPPVGSYVVTGQFELLKPVRLLDLTLLQDVAIETTYFDPEYGDRSNRVAFLKQLGQELTKPVMPDDETREYIATQVIAEFLAHKMEPQIDGIFFRSAQTDPPGENIVLFNHACRVETFEVPQGVNVEVGLHTRAEDDGDYDGEQVVDIWEFVEHALETPNDAETGEDIEPPEDKVVDQAAPYPDPTLRLDVDGLVVHEIKAVKPEYTTMKTERHRDARPLLPP